MTWLNKNMKMFMLNWAFTYSYLYPFQTKIPTRVEFVFERVNPGR